MDVLAGTATSLRVDFTGPLGSLIPDAGSVAWSLYDSTAANLSGPTTIATAPTDTGVTIPIPGTSNAIAAGRRFDKRLVVISYTSGGQGYLVRANYRIVPLLVMTAEPMDVRAIIGCGEDELRDDEVDLVNAYFMLEADVGEGPLAAALATGSRVEIVANQAIVGQCVMDVISGLPQKMAQQQKDGTQLFQRFQTLDLDEVVRRARDMRARGMAAILGLVESNPSLMVLSCPVDPVTDASALILSWP